MTIEKSIGWTDMTLNPIKGKCQGGCWYCWTKPLYKRKFLQPKLNLNLDVFFKLPKKSKKIFLCSTHDLFGSWIPSWWRTAIFERIEANPQHTFQILTKFPHNINQEVPKNAWLGVSITCEKELGRALTLHARWDIHNARLLFISFEPLLGPFNCFKFPDFFRVAHVYSWFIVGALTGHVNKLYDLDIYDVWNIRDMAKSANASLFLKNNLKPIWKENLIQEFPE